MTNEDRLILLREAVEHLGSQAKVGRRLGYSSTTISQVLSGDYGGKVDDFLTRVEEVFGKTEIFCPVLGEIILPICVEERRKPFTTANPHRVRMYQSCRNCAYNTDPKEVD
jgi:hypothetical protein